MHQCLPKFLVVTDIVLSGSGGGGCSPEAVSCPIRRKWFYEVVVTALNLGGKAISVPCVTFNTDKSIVDSGTSNLRLPSAASFIS